MKVISEKVNSLASIHCVIISVHRWMFVMAVNQSKALHLL